MSKKYCCVCRRRVDSSIKFMCFPQDESLRKICMDRFGMDHESYKPWKSFCERHLRADESNTNGYPKKITASAPKKTLTFTSTLVKVSTEGKNEDRNMKTVMLRKQNIAGKSVPSQVSCTSSTRMPVTAELSFIETSNDSDLPGKLIAARGSAPKRRLLGSSTPLSISSKLPHIKEPKTPVSLDESSVLNSILPRENQNIMPMPSLSSVEVQNTSQMQSPASVEIENRIPSPDSIDSSPGDYLECSMTTPTRSCGQRRWFRYFGEIRTPDVQTPRGAKRCLDLARETLMKSRKKIKKLENQNNYLKKKVASLYQKPRGSQKSTSLIDSAVAALKVC